jgi:hypothetical protein
MSRRAYAAAAAVVLLAGCSTTTSGAPQHTAVRPSAPRSTTTTGPAPAPSSSSGPSGGVNAAFSCTSGFVTTLSGYPVAKRVSHYPVPKLTPSPHGLAGQEGLRALRAGELDVVFDRESTGLPKGPSRAMYTCFLAQVRRHGWAPDVSLNRIYRKDHKAGDPQLFSFYDSGSRYKGGNELTVRWFTSKANFGLGALLSVVMSPHQYLPDLHPPR